MDLAPDRVDEIIAEMILRLRISSALWDFRYALSDIGIDDSRFGEMAKSALSTRSKLGNFMDLHEEDILAIFRLAL